MDATLGHKRHRAVGVLAGLAAERAVAFAVAVTTLIPALAFYAVVGDSNEILVRSAIPPMVLIAAVVLPRLAALGVLTCALGVTAYAAANDSGARGVLIGSALVDLGIVAGQLIANHALAPRKPAASSADHGGGPTAAARQAAGAQIRSFLAEPPPVSRPPEWDRLSTRQAAVLALVIEGMTAQTIAERLDISKRTVESHVAAGYAKLGAANRRDLITLCRALDGRHPRGAAHVPDA